MKIKITIVILFGATFLAGFYTRGLLAEADRKIEQSGLSESLEIATSMVERFEKDTDTEEEPKALEKPKTGLTKEDVQDQILAVAEEMGYANTTFLLQLAACESGFRPEVADGRVLGPDGERGIFQFHPYYHPEVDEQCALDVMCATRRAIELIREGRENEWTCYSL